MDTRITCRWNAGCESLVSSQIDVSELSHHYGQIEQSER
jgi:hypothetical protein